MCPPPTFATVPPEILDEIAFHTVASDKLGPPDNLHSLLITSKHIHSSLSTSLALYSRIFRLCFDYDAVARRFNPSGTAIAEQLKARWVVLKRMRRIAVAWDRRDTSRGALPFDWSGTSVTDDLWTSFLLLVESDGRNMKQLVEWANLRSYLDAYMSTTLVGNAAGYDFQPENVATSLSIWVSWLITDEASLVKERISQVESFVGLIRPFVFGAHRYECYFAPWSIFDLPIPSSSPDPPVLPRRYRPMTYDPYMAHDQIPVDNGQVITYMGKPITISAPIMALAAINAYFARVDYHQRVRPAATTVAPVTGAGPAPYVGPGEAPAPVQVVNPTTIISPHYPATNNSSSYDNDFRRLLTCTNPYRPSIPAGESFYTPGAFGGIWEGRFAYFEFDAYRDMLVGEKPPSIVKIDELFRGQQPQVWRVNEFHLRASSAHRRQVAESTNTAIEVPPSGPALNASFPLRSRVVEVPGGLEFHQDGKDILFYEKFAEGGIQEARTEPILDTLLTGSGHSAWGPFTIRGRIRNWDGLATLLKDYSGSDDPMDVSAAHDRGRWLYRGYLVAGGRNWVGRWRDTVTELQYCGYEGAFALHIRR